MAVQYLYEGTNKRRAIQAVQIGLHGYTHVGKILCPNSQAKMHLETARSSGEVLKLYGLTMGGERRIVLIHSMTTLTTLFPRTYWFVALSV